MHRTSDTVQSSSEIDTRAANELTLTDWDPASKQPIFKTAAAQARRVSRGDGSPSSAPTTTASAPSTAGIPGTTGGPAANVHETTIGAVR